MSDGPRVGERVTLTGTVTYVDEDGTLEVAVGGSGDGWWGEVSGDGFGFVKVPPSVVSVSDDRLREALQRIADLDNWRAAPASGHQSCRWCGWGDGFNDHNDDCPVATARER